MLTVAGVLFLTTLAATLAGYAVGCRATAHLRHAHALRLLTLTPDLLRVYQRGASEAGIVRIRK